MADVRIIDTITHHLVTTRYEDIPAESIELAKWRILDVLGCAFGGWNIDGNAELLELLRGWGGAAEATVLGHGGRLPGLSVRGIRAVRSARGRSSRSRRR